MPTKLILDASPLVVLSLLPLLRSFSSLQTAVGKFISLNVKGIRSAIFVKEGQYLHGVESKKRIYFSSRNAFHER